MDRKKITPFILLSGTLMFELSTDINLACLPQMAKDFSTSHSLIQSVISSYLFGFSLLGLLAGSLSDWFGRKRIIIVGFILFSIASLLNIIFSTFYISIFGLLSARFIQGLGAGIGLVMVNTIIRDFYDEVSASRIFSMLWSINALSPTIAPIIGAELASLYGWQINFHFIFLFSLFCLVINVFYLRETLKILPLEKISFSKAIQKYKTIMSSHQVVGYSLISGLNYGALWLWICQIPFYIIDYLGFSQKQYGFVACLSPIFFTLGSQFNKKIVSNLGIERTLKIGFFFTICGTFLLFIFSWIMPTSLTMVIICNFIFGIGLTPVFANTMTRALDVPAEFRGSSAAVVSTIEMAIAALCVFLMGLFNTETMTICGFCMFLLTLAGLGVYSVIENDAQLKLGSILENEFASDKS